MLTFFPGRIIVNSVSLLFLLSGSSKQNTMLNYTDCANLDLIYAYISFNVILWILKYASLMRYIKSVRVMRCLSI
jgi:hypothetical protein